MNHRDDLLEGAKKCLVEKGYAHTTARDIAAASGAHLASIGYHYGSKDALMHAAVISAASEWGDTVAEALEAVRAPDPQTRLAALLNRLRASLPEDRDLLLATVQAYAEAQFSDDLRSALAAAYKEAHREFARLLDPGSEDTPQGRALGSAAYALFSGVILQALIDPDALPDTDALMAALRRLTGAE
ncbi:TetR/AcrR family transcriptional regulator [Nocardiopsis sp. RSe5-2]|uniref:TetR/AcrR family transcriptional regulator n=1 Tax=Nocardiopsis endophytica TaxID=3018445 RepID=A0ABT4U049_9ACTN|nr:TetR/AcrR family transcriptional regulator [Nocardiopsis endophytica]MDA2810324.1 TetR/AcrR family transcriptional regulator [Nocardiopsis endophytica]